jgi:hypothetical protein
MVGLSGRCQGQGSAQTHKAASERASRSGREGGSSHETQAPDEDAAVARSARAARTTKSDCSSAADLPVNQARYGVPYETELVEALLLAGNNSLDRSSFVNTGRGTSNRKATGI